MDEEEAWATWAARSAKVRKVDDVDAREPIVSSHTVPVPSLKERRMAIDDAIDTPEFWKKEAAAVLKPAAPAASNQTLVKIGNRWVLESSVNVYSHNEGGGWGFYLADTNWDDGTQSRSAHKLHSAIAESKTLEPASELGPATSSPRLAYRWRAADLMVNPMDTRQVSAATGGRHRAYAPITLDCIDFAGGTCCCMSPEPVSSRRTSATADSTRQWCPYRPDQDQLSFGCEPRPASLNGSNGDQGDEVEFCFEVDTDTTTDPDKPSPMELELDDRSKLSEDSAEITQEQRAEQGAWEEWRSMPRSSASYSNGLSDVTRRARQLGLQMSRETGPHMAESAEWERWQTAVERELMASGKLKRAAAVRQRSRSRSGETRMVRGDPTCHLASHKDASRNEYQDVHGLAAMRQGVVVRQHNQSYIDEPGVIRHSLSYSHGDRLRRYMLVKGGPEALTQLHGQDVENEEDGDGEAEGAGQGRPNPVPVQANAVLDEFFVFWTEKLDSSCN